MGKWVVTRCHPHSPAGGRGNTGDSLSEFHVSHQLLHNGISALFLWYSTRVEVHRTTNHPANLRRKECQRAGLGEVMMHGELVWTARPNFALRLSDAASNGKLGLAGQTNREVESKL